MVSALVLSTGLVVYLASSAVALSAFLVCLAVFFFVAAILLTVGRQEKQSQRSNLKAQTLMNKVDEVRKKQAEAATIDETVVTPQDLAAGLGTLRSAVLAISSVTDRQQSLLERESALFEEQRAEAVSRRVEATPMVTVVSEADSDSSVDEDSDPVPVSPEIVIEGDRQPENESTDSRSVRLHLNGMLPESSFLPLGSDPSTVEIVLNKATRVEVCGTLSILTAKEEARMAVVFAECFDAQGRKINFQTLPSYSESFGYFTYLEAKSTKTDFRIAADVPRNATTLKLNFIKWAGYCELSNKLDLKLFEENPQWALTRRPREIRVAAILDEFSYNSFKYECNLLSLDPVKWREQLDSFQPDIFFCESAWSGQDSDKRPWKGRVYTSTNFKGENREALLGILEYCSDMEIPTVFWNKEDPSHYEDKIHNFIDTALKFDHIFTTDVDCVQRYQEEYGHPSVRALPFAVQPRLFNPIETGKRSSDVTFAGGWYANHLQRSEDMTKIFRSVVESGRGLKIYDRFAGSGDESHDFPSEFQEYLNPPVPNESVSEVYKESEISLTINTETKSPSMFARRIFELMACNTFVVSNYSLGVEEFFGKNVLYLDKDRDALQRLSQDELLRTRQVNLENVLKNHTYEKRFAEVLDAAKISYNRAAPRSAVVVLASDVNTVESIWRKLQGLNGGEFIRTIAVSSSVSALDFADLLTDYNTQGIRIVYLPSLASGALGKSQLLGEAVDASIVDASYFLDNDLEVYEVGQSRMHSQYIDLPIVSRVAETLGGMREQYSIAIGASEPAFVTRERSVEHLRSLDRGESFKAYVI